MSKKLEIKHINKSNLPYEIPYNVKCIQWILNVTPGLSIIWIAHLAMISEKLIPIPILMAFNESTSWTGIVACGRFDFKMLLILLVVLG